jgi:prepilin-type N-terminal cleavage/methylation domain-containing protein/prepilin-type processing-associated H-X9-DG protein
MQRRQRGFTLIELLVIITIIAILVALVVPAISAAREHGRQVQCLNNEIQIGKAILEFETAHKHLPGVLNQTWYKVPNTTATTIVNFNWVEAILPHLERQDLWDQILASQTNSTLIPTALVKVLACPDDSYLNQPMSTNYQCLLSYGINDGFFVNYTISPQGYLSPPTDLGTEGTIHPVAATTSTKLMTRPTLTSGSMYTRGENVSPSVTPMIGELSGDGTVTNGTATLPHVSGPWTTVWPQTSVAPTVTTPSGPFKATALTFYWPVQYGSQPSTSTPTPEAIFPTMMTCAHPGKVMVVFFDGSGQSVPTETTYPQ